MTSIYLEDLAFLRQNPSASLDTRTQEAVENAVRFFQGNDTYHFYQPTTDRYATLGQLSNSILLRECDVVIRNRKEHGGFPVYIVKKEDLPCVLPPLYTLLVRKDETICPHFLFWTVSRSVSHVQKDTQTGMDAIVLHLREIRDLRLFWPEREEQQRLVELHRRAAQQLRSIYQGQWNESFLRESSETFLAPVTGTTQHERP